ncbi:MAG: hypothetical protein PHD43_00135 [Methylococcales bacterium]|nr:hypothetical protein [Methylococcales bacterium]
MTILREEIRAEKVPRPFQIDAMVILPDHIHALWTLPTDDADYSIRWRNIKRSFTQQIEPVIGWVKILFQPNICRAKCVGLRKDATHRVRLRFCRVSRQQTTMPKIAPTREEEINQSEIKNPRLEKSGRGSVWLAPMLADC